MLHVVRALANHPSRNLCLTGGVALNCVANARILRDTDYRRVWVPPCASDTGAPLGSALWHQHQTLGRPRAFELTHPYYGTNLRRRRDRARACGQAGLSYRPARRAELIAEVARRSAEGQIVGWFQGRSEMGPRALGNRSILADPRGRHDEGPAQRAHQAARALSPVRARRAGRAGLGILRDRPARPVHDDGAEGAGRQAT